MESLMPEPFEPERLRAGLRPLAAALQAHPEVAAYQRFYGLDLAARHPTAQVRLGSFEAGGYQLAVQLWSPPQPRATLLLLHGYYDHMGLYRHAVDWALGMGFAVLACDLPGHGLSSGTRASIDDFAEYQAALHGLFAEAEALGLPQPWHLFGQSTGGAILLDYLLTGEPRPELGETILLAPLVRPRAWGWSQFSYRLLSPFVEAIPRRFSVNSNDAEFIEFVHKLDPLQPRTLPTAWVGALARWIPRIEAAPRSSRSPLIVQGDADLTVDWQHNLQVLQSKFAEPQVLMLPQARHHLANETEETRRRYFAFLSERLA
jgi:alpha-beta hydrolase superfamily lysophospholipase